MKLELKAKYLQYLSQKKQDEGFTLIELLVVIIIIGILSAIALPSFLNQANKAKQSEAKQYVGSMNRAEQAFYLEKNGFTTSIPALGLGIKTGTANYNYVIKNSGAKLSLASEPDTYEQVGNNGLSNIPTLRSYLGSVVTGNTDPTAAAGSGSNETTTLASLCETKDPGKIAVGAAVVASVDAATKAPNCPGNYLSVSR